MSQFAGIRPSGAKARVHFAAFTARDPEGAPAVPFQNGSKLTHYQQFEPPVLGERVRPYNRNMIFESFPVGPIACNCTILGDEEAREAIVIDPGDEVGRIHSRLTELGLKLKQILVTHAHIDHVGGALKLKRLTGAPIFLNENDIPLLKMIETQAAWLGVRAPETAAPDESLTDGLIVGLERYPAQVLHTPGHTQGSVCLHFAPLKLLIAGDTLFAGSIGRTDMPGGNYGQIIDSLHTRLLALPDETEVLPGHGPVTTIGEERSSNPFLQGR